MIIRTFYVAGPMRGYPKYNWPAFDRVRDCLQAQGYKVISPADLDREAGFSCDTPPEQLTEETVRELFSNSVNQMNLHAHAVVLLPGWKKSRGAQAEVACAKAISLPLYVWVDGVIYPYVDDEADGELMNEVVQITTHDRQSQYGSPNKDFEKIASMWSAIFEHSFRPTDVALALICLKISRLSHAIKVDSLRDIGGYARCAYQIYLEDERRRAGGPIIPRATEAHSEEVSRERRCPTPAAGDQANPDTLRWRGANVLVSYCGENWTPCEDPGESPE